MKTADVPYFIRRVGIWGSSFEAMAELALEQLAKLDGKAEVVCGPITSGGYQNTVVNLLVFNHAIEVLQSVGRPIWSQIPFEYGLAELENGWWQNHPDEDYCLPILTEFYQPIFQSGLIGGAWFLDGARGWETSTGAKWEDKILDELGVPRYLFQESWHSQGPTKEELARATTLLS